MSLGLGLGLARLAPAKISNLPEPHRNMRLIAVGDSLTDNASSGDIITLTSSWVWACAKSGYEYYQLDDAGIAGEDVQSIYARFSTDVVAQNPDVVLYCGGANNIGKADTPSEILDVIIDSIELLPLSVPVLVGYVPQRTQSLGGMTTQEIIDKTNAVNALIADINTSVSNAYPAGPYTAYDALPLESNGDKGGTFDGLHWNYQGGYTVGGEVWAPVLASIAPSLAIENEAILNAEFLGTSGNTRFGASGTIVDDWRGTQGVYTASSGVQEVTISASASALFDQLNTDITSLAGEVCQASIDIEITSGSLNLSLISLRARVENGGTTKNSYSTLYMTDFSTEVDGKFRLTTQPFDVSTNTILDTLLTMETTEDGPATIEISNPKLYVVPPV